MNYFKNLRENIGINQTELSLLLNISHDAVNNAENNKILSDQTLLAYSRLFNIDIGILYKENRKPMLELLPDNIEN